MFRLERQSTISSTITEARVQSGLWKVAVDGRTSDVVAWTSDKAGTVRVPPPWMTDKMWQNQEGKRICHWLLYTARENIKRRRTRHVADIFGEVEQRSPSDYESAYRLGDAGLQGVAPEDKIAITQRRERRQRDVQCIDKALSCSGRCPH